MKHLAILSLLFGLSISYAQVGIGTTMPDASAMLQVDATDKGVLIPRVSLLDVTNTTSPINSPATGLVIWNTNTTVSGGNGVGFYFFNGSRWISTKSNTLDDAYDEGGPGAGRTIISDALPVRIDGGDGLWVTGTYGSGAALEASTTNSKMFFYPRKSAFRAGFDDTNSWIDANIGEYSAGFGRNSVASGLASFVAGEQNTSSGDYSASFGTFNTSSGNASFSTGNTNVASGDNAFVSGSNTVASGDNAAAIGRGLEAPSYAESAFGSFNTTYIPSSATSFIATDRIFSIGYGSGSGSRRDALEVYKNGTVRINNTYNLPLTDGSANQVMTTDGSGSLSWTTQSNSNLTVIPVYAANNTVTVSAATFSYVNGTRSAIIPSDINASGNVQVKCVIKYNSISGGSVTDNQFQIRVNDGATNANIITETDSWVNTSTAAGGIYESGWVNWNGGAAVYQLLLRGQNIAGQSMSVENVYLMVKSQ